MPFTCKKYAVLGITTLSVLAFPSLASADAQIQSVSYAGYPGPASPPVDVTVTAAPDDPGHPTTKTWYCDAYNPDSYTVSGHGNSVVCHYDHPESQTGSDPYVIQLNEIDSSGALTQDSTSVTVLPRGDQPGYLYYAGPNSLGAHQTFGFRSPKRHVYVYTDYAPASAVACAAGSPRDERCFQLSGVPTHSDVQIHVKAWNGDESYADGADKTVYVVPDPPPAFTGLSVSEYHKRHGPSCTYGTVLGAHGKQGAYVVVKSHLEGKLPHHSWRVLALSHHTGASYVRPGRVRFDRSLGVRTNRGLVRSYLRNHHATFRYVVDQVVLYASGRTVYNPQPAKYSISRRHLATCSFDHNPKATRISALYAY